MPIADKPRIATWYERLNVVRAMATIIAAAIVLVVIAGALARIVEPQAFTSLGLAYWWAIETVTTVGYGDIVPQSVGGRVVGSLLMLTGLSLIPLLTSVIVAALISKESRQQTVMLEQELATSSEALRRIEERLARIEGTGSSSS